MLLLPLLLLLLMHADSPVTILAPAVVKTVALLLVVVAHQLPYQHAFHSMSAPHRLLITGTTQARKSPPTPLATRSRRIPLHTLPQEISSSLQFLILSLAIMSCVKPKSLQVYPWLLPTPSFLLNHPPKQVLLSLSLPLAMSSLPVLPMSLNPAA